MPDDTLTLPIEPAPPDNTGLLSVVADLRRQLADPASIYATRPDLAAATELNIKAMLLRAGANEPVETVQTVAERQHEAMFSHTTPPALTEMMDERCEALEKLGKPVIDRMAEDLRQELGAKAYDGLVADAHHAFGPGHSIPAAALADRHVLRLLAAHGRYMRAYETSKPRT